MIELPWPPTVNHYYTIARGRKILSKKGRQYRKTAITEAIIQQPGKTIEGPVSVYIRAYPPDKRKRDIDNILKPVLDALTTARVYGDDSQVTDLRIVKFNPSKPGRVEITVCGTD
ncbi:MAG: RusA family crossover junction endodeoxyribonuclease [bacterium]|nr:RusA family crossover junction endodeoxyribonuclease [bacterium]